jgi:hypothetical protein
MIRRVESVTLTAAVTVLVVSACAIAATVMALEGSDVGAV